MVLEKAFALVRKDIARLKKDVIVAKEENDMEFVKEQESYIRGMEVALKRIKQSLQNDLDNL